ncbi:MAG: hypothetical protein K2F95_07895 [Alistipes sp.]|nr:hypothetical protein [Alistipes sp.]
MQARNEEFDKYVNSLNAMICQESRSRLESFYALHAPLLCFFEIIDSTIKTLLKKKNLHPDSVSAVEMQITDVLPQLEKMKADISLLAHDDFSQACMQQLTQHIEYVRKSMSVDEVAEMSGKLSELIDINANAVIAEKKERKEEAVRKAKEEREDLKRREKERLRKEQAAERLSLKRLETDYKSKFRSICDDLTVAVPGVDKSVARAERTMWIGLLLCIPLVTAVVGLPLFYWGCKSKLKFKRERYAIDYAIGILKNELQ